MSDKKPSVSPEEIKRLIQEGAAKEREEFDKKPKKFIQGEGFEATPADDRALGK